EEKDFHACIEIKDIRIDGDIKWVFDGSKWYPLRVKKRSIPSDENLRLEQSDEDYTEPLKDGFKYYASFLVIR
ncbi:MAG: hypothetical protein PXX83_00320, partial [Candidatus Nitrosotalea sp.]|nr:hypothetical protein [Candidatus Nitrosotalea sp.]